MSEWKKVYADAILVGENFKRSEMDVISVLQRAESEKVYLHLEMTSLFQFGLSVLKLSEDQCFTYIRLARASTKIPELKIALDNKEVTPSNAKRIAPHLTPENQEFWIGRASELKARELDKELAAAFPKQAGKERIKHVNADVAELRCSLSPRAQELLKRAQEIFNQNEIGALIEKGLELLVKRHDPLVKATRVRKVVVTKPVYKNRQRTATPPALVNLAKKKSDGSCSFVDSRGVRCTNRRYLHVHHVNPVARGGKHSLDNLEVLCSVHHRREHGQQWH